MSGKTTPVAPVQNNVHTPGPWRKCGGKTMIQGKTMTATRVHDIVHCSDLTLGREHEGVLMAASKLENVDSIRDALSPYYNLLVAMYENELLPIEEDYRSGADTYGYENLEAIQGSLLYISDRWKACFRVRWMIDLINPRYCLWGGSIEDAMNVRHNRAAGRKL